MFKQKLPDLRLSLSDDLHADFSRSSRSGDCRSTWSSRSCDWGSPWSSRPGDCSPSRSSWSCDWHTSWSPLHLKCGHRPCACHLNFILLLIIINSIVFREKLLLPSILRKIALLSSKICWLGQLKIFKGCENATLSFQGAFSTFFLCSFILPQKCYLDSNDAEGLTCWPCWWAF